MSDSVDGRRLTNFERALERLYDATKTKTPTELQEALEISRQAFHKAKKNDSVPASWAKKIQEKYGVNSDWTIRGTGHKDMESFHANLSNKIYMVRDLAFLIIRDVNRYGPKSIEYKWAEELLASVERLRDRLDERAFKECTNLSKKERLRIYYQGGDRTSPLLNNQGAQDIIVDNLDGSRFIVEVKVGSGKTMSGMTALANHLEALKSDTVPANGNEPPLLFLGCEDKKKLLESITDSDSSIIYGKWSEAKTNALQAMADIASAMGDADDDAFIEASIATLREKQRILRTNRAVTAPSDQLLSSSADDQRMSEEVNLNNLDPPSEASQFYTPKAQVERDKRRKENKRTRD